MAIGKYSDSGKETAFAERWDGSASTVCAAVGENKKEGKAFGETWNGSEWKTLPTFSSGYANGTRYGVTCVSATSCRAVGTTSSETAVAETWTDLSGSGNWTRAGESPPNPEGGSAVKLRDISCTASNACTAVGSYVKGGVTKTLAERYSSGSWSIQTTPNPESGNAELLGVSCDSSTSCMAVGKAGSGPYAARWNGTSWSVISSPNPAEAKGSYLLGISCASASSCSAVGYWATDVLGGGVPAKSKTLTLSWGGSEWAIQFSPNPSSEAFLLPRLSSVSCSAANACTAVGRQDSQGNSKGFVTLGERYE